MKTTIALALTVSAFVSLVAAARPAPTSTILHMTWNISVDAGGHVTQLTTTDKQVPGIHGRLEQAIRGWRFNPGKVDGKSAPTDSKLHVTLEVMPDESGTTDTVRVVGATTGGGWGTMMPPHYPDASRLTRRQGLVVLKIRYDDAGHIVDAVLADGAPRVDAPFVEAAVAIVHKWTYEPELVGGHPKPGAVLMPFCFRLRGPHVAPLDCNWHKPGSSAPMPGDQVVALEPAATLQTDVNGRVL